MDQTLNLELLEQEQEEQLFDLDVRITELLKVTPDGPEFPSIYCETGPVHCRTK
ncbi:hypothetical protein [Ktedonosporobacter rubrisoli]|uniref:hypothetical protein n=1 Tax=Ktedonosporobacter rubrisoli TaxID=2509675 RepID=UPI0013EE51D0|nr:hypothetical protein [Ktedonosporobacter rubrisoli]